MNVPQETLDRLAADVLTLRARVLRAARLHGREQFDALQVADIQFAGLITRLKDAGAADPRAQPCGRVSEAVRRQSQGVPLELLNTPANRRYADTLRAALDAGLAVDRERYGESIGTDGAAQIIEGVLLEVEEELCGPMGAGE